MFGSLGYLGGKEVLMLTGIKDDIEGKTPHDIVYEAIEKYGVCGVLRDPIGTVGMHWNDLKLFLPKEYQPK